MREAIILDRKDRVILRLLQDDATLSLSAIAKEVALSKTPCWKRIQRLEAAGIIRRRVTLLDPAKVGAGVTVFVSIRAGEHSLPWLEAFAAKVSAMPEVVELYRMSGDIDYQLRVVVPDIATYDAFYKRLIEAMPLGNVTSRFAMEQIKYTTAVPL